MKYDEFAFFNRQLASMLKDGIPLEGALRQLSRGMRSGHLRREIEALGANLAAGTPLDQALEGRDLPELYVRMLRVGVKSNNLPGVLTLLADHYRNQNYIWTRLKGLMVYPVIVLGLSLALSVWLLVELRPLYSEMLYELGGETSGVQMARYHIFAFPILLSAVLFLILCALYSPALRRFVNWRVPPFKHAKLAQTASAMSMLLRGGCTLSEAIDTLLYVEADSPAGEELARWQEYIEAGDTRLSDFAYGGRVFPSLFMWLVEGAGEDLADGFAQAARMYRERAAHGVEMMLYGMLPASVLVLGGLVLTQVQAVFGPLIKMMEQMG